MTLARLLSRRQLAISIAYLLSIASIASAQPVPDGIAVGSTGQPQDQGHAVVCGDGGGGYFVAWSEEVLNSTTGVDGYLQHVLADGQLDPNWPTRGMPFVDAPNTQDVEAMVADGSGGVILYWLDSRSPLSANDLYALRVNVDGQLAAGWTPNGTPVCTGLNGRQLESMCPDGAGGAYFAWDDSIQATERARVTHLTGDGSLAPGWPLGGKLVTGTAPANGGACLLAELDGYLVTWIDLRGQTQYGLSLFSTRFTAAGDVYPGWNPTGTQLLTLGTVTAEWRAATDGAGGAFVAWDDNRVGSPPWFAAYDIYAQHVFADGTRDARWPKDGFPVCATPDAQNYFDIAADGSGGCVLIWQDNRLYFVYGQRMRADGSVAPGWAPNGVSVRNLQFAPYTPPWAVADGQGGFYGVWTEHRADQTVVVGQHMQGNGTFDPSWTAGGRILASNFPGGGECDYPAIVADGLGGAALAYERSNVGPWLRIYAMHIRPDIPTPTRLTFADERPGAGTARLTWFTPDGAGQRATAQRSTDGASWDDVAQLTSDAAGEFVLEDRVPAGGRFDYRLGVVAPGGEQFTDGHWVVIPVGVAFGLTSVGPNPSRGSVTVTFAMAEPGAASLDLFNVAGRRVLHHDVTALSVGAHTVELAKDGELPSGVYVLRLVEGRRAAERKIAVVR